MNYAIVFLLLGYVLMIEGALLLLPAAALCYINWGAGGEFSAPLGKVRGPQKLTVHLNVGEKTSNSWDIWVYPRNAQLMQSDTEVLYTTEFGEQAKQHLAAGKKVVLPPAPNKVKGRKSTFHNHFWTPHMFAWAPMTIACQIHA